MSLMASIERERMVQSLRTEETAAKERALKSSQLEDKRIREKDIRAREADFARLERADEITTRKAENESIVSSVDAIIQNSLAGMRQD